MVQDAKNNEVDQVWSPNTLSQTIQGNFYEQTPQKLEPKPCSRRSNSESDVPDRRQWILPFSPKAISENDNPDRRQRVEPIPLQSNAENENPDRRQWIPPFSQRPVSENNNPDRRQRVEPSPLQSNLEGENPDRRQWIPPFSPKPISKNENPDRRQWVESNPPQSNSESENPDRRQWIPPFSPKAISKNDNPSRRQWIPPFSPKSVKLSGDPDHKQEVRRNDPDLKSVNSDQELDVDDNNLQSSRSAITINSTPLEFGEDHDQELSTYLRESPTETRLPGFEPIFAPNSAFDIDVPTDFFTAPSPPIKVNPSEDLNSKPLNDLQTKLLNSESESDSVIRSAKPALRSQPEPTKCSNVNNTRRSFSSYNDDSESDSFNSDKAQNYNDQYEQSRSGNDKALNSVLYPEKSLNAVKDNQDDNRKSLSDSDKNKASSYQSVARLGRPQFNEARREMIEPTRGNPSISQSQLLLMQTERICYACSTANNPSCWAPDRRTTVKYCRKGNNACLTKTFGSGSKCFNQCLTFEPKKPLSALS